MLFFLELYLLGRFDNVADLHAEIQVEITTVGAFHIEL